MHALYKRANMLLAAPEICRKEAMQSAFFAFWRRLRPQRAMLDLEKIDFPESFFRQPYRYDVI
jgi:hypothetical protein